MYPFINILNYKIPVYGLLFVSGLIVSYFFAYRRTIKGGLSADGLLIITAFAISSAVFGAKILYLSVSLPRELLIGLIKDGKFDLLMRGGFVFYGGLAVSYTHLYNIGHDAHRSMRLFPFVHPGRRCRGFPVLPCPHNIYFL